MIANKDCEFAGEILNVLNHQNYSNICICDANEAPANISEVHDMVIIINNHQDLTGLSIIKALRQKENVKNIPVLLLSSKPTEAQEIAALDMGVNDFISLPVSADRLIARIKANLKKTPEIHRKSNVHPNTVKIGPLEIDKDKHEVLIEGKRLFLPRKEFAILYYLASQPEKVIARDKLFSEIWGSGSMIKKRTVDVHIRKIRIKMGNYSNVLQTIKGTGYKIILSQHVLTPIQKEKA